MLESLGEPFMSSTLILPAAESPMTDTQEMVLALKGQVELIIDGGYCGSEPTTVVDLTDDNPRVARYGLGDASAFESAT